MNPASEQLVIGDLTFSLRRSDRRKTVGITIDRGGELILTAPDDCPLPQIERIAHEKRFWIYTKLAEKAMLMRPVRAKEYVNGEGFYYLGRSYRLMLVDSSIEEHPSLRFHQGRFMLRRDERQNAPILFTAWYIAHGQPWIRRRIALFAERLGVTPGPVRVQDLGYRWGSCGGGLNFHWRVILLPPLIIDYVIAHELVHLVEPHHSVAFWQHMERIMPDFAARKQWLAENGMSYF